MSPLSFVNWHSVNGRFRGLMWMLVLVLAVVIIAHSLPRSAVASPQGQAGVRAQPTLAMALRGKR
jgi:hypothetical protein